jgi:hypothetical protein
MIKVQMGIDYADNSSVADALLRQGIDNVPALRGVSGVDTGVACTDTGIN